MKLVLIGPPACGKGTIAAMLTQKLGIPVVSTGATLRALPKDSKHYKEIDAAMDSGKLAPNDIVGSILAEEINNPKYNQGYILDGWYRQITDKDFFDANPDKVIYIKISDKTAIRRISGRRICQDDGKIYNIYTLPKEELEQMLTCKVLIHRDDDKEDVVKVRLKSFYDQTIPVIEHFREIGKLIEIDGEGTPEEVFDLVLSALKVSK